MAVLVVRPPALPPTASLRRTKKASTGSAKSPTERADAR